MAIEDVAAEHPQRHCDMERLKAFVKHVEENAGDKSWDTWESLEVGCLDDPDHLRPWEFVAVAKSALGIEHRT